MRGILNNIINFYQMQAKVLGVLVANTQKALNEFEKKKKADEQMQRIESFVKDLTMNLNNMLTKFRFLKERKNRKQEQFTESQTKTITEFAIFVKSLASKVSSLLKRFQAEGTFQEKVDKEIKELEISVRQKLKEFEEALDETKGTLTNHIINSIQNTAGSFARFFGIQKIFPANNKKADSLLGESPQNTNQDSSTRVQGSGDSKLENLFNCSDIKPVMGHNKKSKCLIGLKV